ncbi:cytochrome c biogenesis protein ResB [uncultured Nocardioides sp.]|uniref:Ccs1/ResB-related putative cytochrome C-type biogenesis protein n=1 Tax=uncultured Nocardioides sp. TaxID=198441 RepID=A0A6J4P4P8_9ACTN|nr:cytochrome c biogenesis protein ResB [uncultured Nocardioides sp.]CAA9406259.1 MAG: Ccs1/ResB-related putative cytochrome C-type biogenesis protein [uncultured Nocardioides sp.]
MSEPATPRRAGELTLRETARWSWRQLTSMRTALILLLLLALAAVPGSIVPQQDVDSLKTSRWQEAHPTLTPIYEWLGLFSVYDSPWFAAIYLLLMVSLVGCIIPRTAVYWRAMGARPPRAPARLDRLPHSASYTTQEETDDVLARAARVLRKRRFRVDVRDAAGDATVAAERGYLREAGNLVFHISVVVVLVGFAMGSLFGYRGGAIVVVGGGFANDVRSYDDFLPGSLFRQEWMEPFSFDIDDFEVDWLESGPRSGMAQNFVSHLSYRESPDAPEEAYDLRVNHPLSIGDTEVFLIGHGYAPVITVTDGEGNVALSGPTVFLPNDQTFRSFGVVKAHSAEPTEIGLQGELYPTFAFREGREGGPYSAFGNALDPLISMTVYTGDLSMGSGAPQSIYALDTSRAEQVTKADGSMFRLDLRPGETAKLPDGAGSVTFEGLQRWNKLQISRTPGKLVALTGVSLALLGLLGSLFIRPRRVWIRVRREAGQTLVELGGLDRSDGGDVAEELEDIRQAIKEDA